MTDEMPGELSPAQRRAELDRRLDTVLSSADAEGLSLARSSVIDCSDRWYGQLVALSYNSVADVSDADAVLPASTAIELLRGYCRLRSELLVQLDDETAHSLVRNPTAALLAGDYLNSAAYSAFGTVDHDCSGDGFETLTTVSNTITRAFEARYVQPMDDYGSFLDGTAGTLGEGAAVIGATLAGVDTPRREQFAVLGRGYSTARQIQYTLDSDRSAGLPTPSGVDERQLRRHGENRLDEATRELDRLASTADVEALREFVAEHSTPASRGR